MGEGAGSPPRPGAPLPSASLRARSPESRCAPQPAVRWASVWGPSCRPTAAPLREGSRTEREGRGKGRDETQGGAAEGRGKAGCVCRGRVGWGRLCQFQPGGCVFYLFIFKKFVMSHITQTSRRRGGSGWGSEGGRLREVNLKIPLIEGL